MGTNLLLASAQRWIAGFAVYHDDFRDYSTNEPLMEASR